jgi:hypothetical protein
LLNGKVPGDGASQKTCHLQIVISPLSGKKQEWAEFIRLLPFFIPIDILY